MVGFYLFRVIADRVNLFFTMMECVGDLFGLMTLLALPLLVTCGGGGGGGVRDRSDHHSVCILKQFTRLKTNLKKI